MSDPPLAHCMPPWSPTFPTMSLCISSVLPVSPPFLVLAQHIVFSHVLVQFLPGSPFFLPIPDC